MVQVRDGLAPIPETSIMNYHMFMENQRALKILEECRHVKPWDHRMVERWNPLQATVANRRIYGEILPRPFFSAGEAINCWPPGGSDSFLVLTTDMSDMKAHSSEEPHQDWEDTRFWEKGHAPTGRAPVKELFRRIWEDQHRQPKGWSTWILSKL